GDRAIQKVGPPGLSGAFGWARDIQDVVEHLEGDPDPVSEVTDPAATGGIHRPAAQHAGGFEKTSRLESAPLEVLVLPQIQVPGPSTLHQLPAGEIDRRGTQFTYRLSVTAGDEDVES